MTKHLYLLFFISLILGTGFLKAEPVMGSGNTNLLTNPGFEEGIIKPNGWTFTVYNDDDELLNSEIVNSSYSGNNALHIVTTLQADQEWALWSSLRGISKLKVTPGDTLEYSVMILANNIDVKISKSFITYDYRGYELGEDEGSMDITMPFDQYVKYTSRYIIPEDVAYVTPRLFGHGSCDIIVDDFELKGTFKLSFSSMGEGSVVTPEEYHKLGSETEINAVPDAGYRFAGWLGDYVGNENPATITVSGDMNITARFIEEGTELNHLYYMSTDGSDDNDGSEEHPWATLTYGSSQLYPDDTLIVKTGVYHTVKDVISRSGGNGHYITILGESGAIFEGTSQNVDYGIVSIVDASWVILDHIMVRNARSHGIKVLGKCKHIILRNNKTEHTQFCGIMVQGSRGYPWDRMFYISDILLEYNEVHWPQEGYFNGLGADQEDITLTQGVEHFEIRYNYVNAYDSINYHGGPIAIDVKDGVRYGKIHHNTTEYIPSSGIYIDAWDTYAHHIDIYQNYIYYVTAFGIEAGAERGGPIDSVLIYNNIINKTGWAGIGSGNYNGGTGPTYNKSHIDIFNNTIAHAGYLDWGWGILTESSFKEGKIYNNIMYDCKPNAMDLNRQDNNVVTNNCLYKLIGTDSGDEGKNALKEDPRFVDQANADFHLEKTSPCIDAGITEGAPSFDYAGTARPIGKGYDMGAYEVEGVGAVLGTLSPVKDLKVYPNPFSDHLTISYSLKQSSSVRLSLLDVYGKELKVVEESVQTATDHSITWRGSKLSAGIYFVKMQYDSRIILKKVVLSK